VAFKTSHHPWVESIKERIYGDDPQLAAGKPDPAPYLLAAKRLNVNPSECWAFEDSNAGMKSAEAAGCRVWVLSSDSQKDPLTRNPCRVESLEVVLNQLVNTSG
jgi:beta-phosphoglucomutase-like phosphatase (HAD superfamily)